MGSGRGRRRGNENMVVVESKSEAEAPTWLVHISPILSVAAFLHISTRSFLSLDVSFNADSMESIQ
jgi:hypothetical protein